VQSLPRPRVEPRKKAPEVSKSQTWKEKEKGKEKEESQTVLVAA
jgi:hypothetical protein